MKNRESNSNKKELLSDFVLFERSLLRNFRDGEITRNEFITYCYIRLLCNPYGVALVSLENIKNDLLIGGSVNYCNKILLSLKKKKYIHFDVRRGRRGSFNVLFGFWKLPNGKIAWNIEDRLLIQSEAHPNQGQRLGTPDSKLSRVKSDVENDKPP